MKRVVVYNVDNNKPKVATSSYSYKNDDSKKKDAWMIEKRQRALRTIHNASILSGIIKNIEELKSSKSSNSDDVLKEAIEKISSIVEEMRLDFKKDYWD